MGKSYLGGVKMRKPIILSMALGIVLAGGGCTQNKEVSSIKSQTVEAKGQKGIAQLRVTGQTGVPDKVSLDNPVKLPITIDVQGPAGGAVQLVVNMGEGASQGCVMLEEFSYSLPLDASGRASETKLFYYGNPKGCAIDVVATVGSERTKQATGLMGAVAENMPGGDLDEARLSFQIHSQ